VGLETGVRRRSDIITDKQESWQASGALSLVGERLAGRHASDGKCVSM
jgi:hypothetical protein